MSTYGYLYLPTGVCVHFIDKCPSREDLVEIFHEAQGRNIRLIYVDCAEFTSSLWDIPNRIGVLANTSFPPYDEDGEPHWTRWWDDLLSLGHDSDVHGLAIILDNAHLAFDQNRKFMTNLLESFLHGMKSWIKSEKPYHLHFQMVPCETVKQVFSSEHRPGDA